MIACSRSCPVHFAGTEGGGAGRRESAGRSTIPNPSPPIRFPYANPWAHLYITYGFRYMCTHTHTHTHTHRITHKHMNMHATHCFTYTNTRTKIHTLSLSPSLSRALARALFLPHRQGRGTQCRSRQFRRWTRARHYTPTRSSPNSLARVVFWRAFSQRVAHTHMCSVRASTNNTAQTEHTHTHTQTHTLSLTDSLASPLTHLCPLRALSPHPPALIHTPTVALENTNRASRQ